MHIFKVEFVLSITKVKKAREIKQVAAADNILTEYSGYIYFLSQLEDHEIVHVIYFCETVCKEHFF